MKAQKEQREEVKDKWVPKRKNTDIAAWSNDRKKGGIQAEEKDPSKYHNKVQDNVENKASAAFVKKHQINDNQIVKLLVNEFSRMTQKSE